MDRQKALKHAEKLLASGKVEQALDEFKRLAREAASDPLIVNRIGDTLARHGLSDEAIEVYQDLAKRFADGGFLPKAIAIYKKILRLDPSSVDVQMRLGMLYLKRKLPGEARSYLLKAADVALQNQNLDGAREIYEKLVIAEPEVLAHRARLAETLALAGDAAAATDQLNALGQQLLERDELDEAEQTFRRASDLSPQSADALLGLSRCRSQAGQEGKALELLNDALTKQEEEGAVSPKLLGELWVRHEDAGRVDASTELLGRVGAPDIPHEAFRRVFMLHLDRGAAPGLWDRMAPIFNRWSIGEHEAKLIALLQVLADIEEDGHIPALQWLFDVLKARQDRPGMGRTLERLVEAYRARCMVDEASMMLERLKQIAPGSALVQETGPAAAAPPQPTASAASVSAAAAAAASAGAPVPTPQPAASAPAPPSGIAAEAPAVPLDKADESFVTGRLTQAEILEKYGLGSQAIAQLNEIVERFPGHVESQERLVLLLRGQNDAGLLSKALVGLALASRAAGEGEAARSAAREAWQTGHVAETQLKTLRELGLLPDASAAPAVAPTTQAVSAASPPEVSLETGDDDVDLVIEFDEPDAAAQPAASAQPAADESGDGPREPGDELLEEVRFYMLQGMTMDAMQRITMLRQIGYGGARLDALQAEVEQANIASATTAQPIEFIHDEEPSAEAPAAHPQPAEPAMAGDVPLPPPAVEGAAAPVPPELAPAAASSAAVGEVADDVADAVIEALELNLDADQAPPIEIVAPAGAAQVVSPAVSQGTEPADKAVGSAPAAGGDDAAELFDEDDLAMLTAALDSEVFETREAAPAPEEGEQSIEEVFAQFREKVAEQVGQDDYETHYDLGIAYKEMGLMEEAIGEFELAVRSAEKLRDSCVMLARCHLDRQQANDAEVWYRKALDAPGGDEESAAALRYELADLLAHYGDQSEALTMFRDMLASNPSFRDVADRVQELEAQH